MKSAAALHTHRHDQTGLSITGLGMLGTVLLLLLLGVLGTSLATYVYDTACSAVEQAIPFQVLSSVGGADAVTLSPMG